MQILFYILLIILAFFFMEFWAWFSHKYLMHGFLWFLHKDHHFGPSTKNSKRSFYQKNDYFFLIFAIPAIVLIFLGIFRGIPSFIFIGSGITLYGAVYFLVHDVVIHRRLRFPYLQKSRNRYLKAILKAHAAHHVEEDNTKYTNFGLLIFPRRFLKM